MSNLSQSQCFVSKEQSLAMLKRTKLKGFPQMLSHGATVTTGDQCGVRRGA